MFISLVMGAFSYIAPYLVQLLIKWLNDTDIEHMGDLNYAFSVLAALVGSQLMSYILYEHMLYY